MSDQNNKNPQEPGSPEAPRTQYVRQESAQASSPSPRKKRLHTSLFVALVALALVAGIAGMIYLINQQAGELQVHDVPYASGKDNVAVIHVEGAIAEKNDTYNQAWLEKVIQNAKYDKNNQGIALIVDSPGGSVYESDATLLALKDYQAETERPVYTYMEHMAASGGYYIAASSDAITINRNGLTGSIGVIGALVPDVSGLLEKLGVRMDAAYSGANKLMGQGFFPLTEEQKAIFQAMSDEYYQQFVQIVADGRGMSYEEVQALADGRVYTALQAKENGLVDEVFLSFEEFENYFREKEDLADSVRFKNYEYVAPATLLGPLFQTAQSLQSIGQDPTSELLLALEERTLIRPMYLYLS